MSEEPVHTGSGRRQRVVIEDVTPRVDDGRFPAKRIVDEPVTVEADVFCDGHDAVAAVVRWRSTSTGGAGPWREAPMEPLGNDRWRGDFTPDELGMWEFAVVGWVDRWKGWRRDMARWLEAGKDVPVHLEIGAALLEEAAGRAAGADPGDARTLAELAATLRDEELDAEKRAAQVMTDDVAAVMHRHADRSHATLYPEPNTAAYAGEPAPAGVVHGAGRKADPGVVIGAGNPADPGTKAKTTIGLDPGPGLTVWVDRPLARASAWYELFPRSTGPAGEHGTFETAKAVLPYVAELGFDIVYLPPVHPIGRTHRKGKNNATTALNGDVGSPWAIGAAEGGHTAVHPDLGTLEDFRGFVKAAEELGLEVALDIAFQASPDHPWAKEHPSWFRHRPDGSIAYAENPPKKYEDIYPIDFDSEDRESLWWELKGVFDFWIRQGVKVFRVDNPHTKAFRFWEWCIGELRAEHPELIFLSEAFTRPRVMYRLAKLGFTQSYTYFAWRNTRWELEQYLMELTRGPAKDFFRPSFWTNTPDILTEALQTGGRPAFVARLVLAATMTASYGIYGPAFELMEHLPREEGSEEYLDSEKYQLRDWDLDRDDSLRDVVARINAIRKAHPALHRNDTVRFHETLNEHLIAYSKTSRDGADIILVVVNLDPRHPHAGQVEVPLHDWGIPEDASFQVHDLLNDARYTWRGWRNYIELNPHVVPAHVFHVLRDVRSEVDHDGY